MTPLGTIEAQAAAGRRFFVEFDIDEPCPVDFEGDPTIVLFFASWAFSVRFGAMHELAQAALHMERKHRLNLRPLMRYADRNIEDDADRHELERSWQPSADLAVCSRAIVGVIETGDEQLAALLEGYESLGSRLAELASICDWGVERGARVRMSFDMGHNEPTAPRPEPHEHGPLLGPLGRM